MNYASIKSSDWEKDMDQRKIGEFIATLRKEKGYTQRQLAEQFEMDTDYTEKEVNEIIKSQIAFSDVELIRRELFQERFLNRLRDGSRYWKENE